MTHVKDDANPLSRVISRAKQIGFLKEIAGQLGVLPEVVRRTYERKPDGIIALHDALASCRITRRNARRFGLLAAGSALVAIFNSTDVSSNFLYVMGGFSMAAMFNILSFNANYIGRAYRCDVAKAIENIQSHNQSPAVCFTPPECREDSTLLEMTVRGLPVIAGVAGGGLAAYFLQVSLPGVVTAEKIFIGTAISGVIGGTLCAGAMQIVKHAGLCVMRLIGHGNEKAPVPGVA